MGSPAKPSNSTTEPWPNCKMFLMVNRVLPNSTDSCTGISIKNILQLGQGSVVELDGLAGEPMDIYVNGYLIAQGEVVVVDDRYGIRITDIITPSDRIHRLRSEERREGKEWSKL